MPSKPMVWFLYDRDLRHERVKISSLRLTYDYLGSNKKQKVKFNNTYSS